MLFSSYSFLFLFLPSFLLTYAIAPVRGRNLVLLAFSWLFYGWWRPDYLLLLVAISALGYLVGQRIARNAGLRRQRWLQFGVIANLAPLLWFKYANLLAASLAQLLGWAGHDGLAWSPILLPIGISFFVFQTLSYLIDIHRRDIEPAPDFIAFAAYLAMFGQLIAGPIVRYANVAPDILKRPFTLAGFAAGCRLFMFGLAQKVLIADSLAPIADQCFALAQPGFLDSWLGVLAYSLQLFFDFSGYSLMAIGLGRMIGFHFLDNFNQPYLASSIQDFWRRWHISLSTWLRDYLYIPLGGNRAGKARAYLNLLITMALGGLWHGANWNFLAWGLLHGGGLAVHRYWQDRRWPTPPWLVGHLLTLLLVMFGWVLFRSPDWHTASLHLASMLAPGQLGGDLLWHWRNEYSAALLAAIGLVYLPMLPAARGWSRGEGWTQTLLAPLLLLWSIALLADRANTPFLYFQF